MKHTMKKPSYYLLSQAMDGDEKAVIRQIKRCLFRQIKTGLSEHLTMG